MLKPDGVVEIFLQPGELYLGDRRTRIRTVLGSCVSLVLWNPQALLGAMCHYMLPSRSPHLAGQLDGRYGDEAMELLREEVEATGHRLREFRLRLYGGGDMFPKLKKDGHSHIGRKNVEAARRIIRVHGLTISEEHVEGVGHRHLIFDVWSGHVYLRQPPPLEFDNPKQRKLAP